MSYAIRLDSLCRNPRRRHRTVVFHLWKKEQERIGFLAAGVGLCLYPYLIEGLILQILIGLGLAAVPFFIDL